MRTTRTTAEQRARELGITLERQGSGFSVELLVQAPAGTVLSGSHLHEAVCALTLEEGNRAAVWHDLYRMALEEMSMGIEPCPDGEACEWCNEEC